MGAFDFILLGITGFIFITSVTLLLISLKKTDDEVKKRYYKKTYMPVLILCVVLFIVHFSVLKVMDVISMLI